MEGLFFKPEEAYKQAKKKVCKTLEYWWETLVYVACGFSNAAYLQVE